MDEPEVMKVQSDLRRPERWRGRARSPFAGWSVFVGISVAIVFGVVFWFSVWLLLRPSESLGSAVTYDLMEEPEATDEEFDGPVAEAADAWSGDPVAAAADAWSGDPVAAATDDFDVDDEQARHAAVDPAEEELAEEKVTGEIEVVAEGPRHAVTSEGPLYGPFLVYGPDVPDAVAEGDDAGEPGAARHDEIAARAEEIAARAGDITTRAEELAAKTEEFAQRIDGLTARIDELEAKLVAADAATTARPSLVPSPGSRSRGSEPTVARTGQAQTGGRGPLVTLPQPGPGSRVAAGPLVLETGARGEAPITQMRLVLDGVPLPISVERKDDKNWRGRTSTRVTPGPHTVAVSVVDGQGRVGSYRWEFSALAQ
jgi:hypothetical protein